MIIRPKRPAINRKEKINNSCVNTTLAENIQTNIIGTLIRILGSPQQAYSSIRKIQFEGHDMLCLGGLNGFNGIFGLNTPFNPHFNYNLTHNLARYVLKYNKLYYIEYDIKSESNKDAYTNFNIADYYASPTITHYNITNKICIDDFKMYSEAIDLLKKMVTNILNYYEYMNKLESMKIKI